MKRTRNPDEKRERILEATRQILRDGGYFTRFSLAKVAEEAGVSKGGLLHHFPSKEALLTAVSHHLIAQFEDQLQQAKINEPNTPGQFTRAYVQTALESQQTAQISPVLLAFLRAADANAPSRFTYWHQQTEQDGLDEVTATIIRLAVDGLLYTEMIDAQAVEPALRERILLRLQAMAVKDTGD